jgi:hypothetical protein
MNPYRQYQPIAAVWVEQAWKFGHDLEAHYAAGGSPNSAAVTGPWKVDHVDFARSKAGEVAVAAFFGLDPAMALKWIANHPDDGHDLALPILGFDLLIDVKASNPEGNLIWPQTKNGFFWDVNFHVLMSASVERHGDDLSQVWIEGFCTKREFYQHKRIADGTSSPRLSPGTWYLPKRCLHPLQRGPLTYPHELMAQTLVEMLACQTKPVELPRIDSPAMAIKNGMVREFITGQIELPLPGEAAP